MQVTNEFKKGDVVINNFTGEIDEILELNFICQERFFSLKKSGTMKQDTFYRTWRLHNG